MFECFVCIYVFVPSHASDQRGQKRMLYLLKPQLQMIISCQVGHGDQTWLPWKNQHCSWLPSNLSRLRKKVLLILYPCWKLKINTTSTFLLYISTLLITFAFIPKQWMPVLIMLNGYRLCSYRLPHHFPCILLTLIMWHHISLVKSNAMFPPDVSYFGWETLSNNIMIIYFISFASNNNIHNLEL